MGFFSFLKNRPDEGCIKFLNEADAAYVRAFQIKNVAGLDRYFDRTCLSLLAERVRLSEKVYSGLERYKHVTWEKQTDLTFIKEVNYDDVKLSKGICCSVGESYTEEWTLILYNNTYKVSKLRRLT